MDYISDRRDPYAGICTACPVCHLTRSPWCQHSVSIWRLHSWRDFWHWQWWSSRTSYCTFLTNNWRSLCLCGPCRIFPKWLLFLCFPSDGSLEIRWADRLAALCVTTQALGKLAGYWFWKPPESWVAASLMVNGFWQFMTVKNYPLFGIEKKKFSPDWKRRFLSNDSGDRIDATHG